MPPPRNKPLIRLTSKRRTDQQVESHRQTAFAAIRRLYGEVVPLWRFCQRGDCRRHRCCNGEARACLKSCWPLMPEPVQQRAHAEVIAGGPRRRPATSDLERNLRRYPPSNFVH